MVSKIDSNLWFSSFQKREEKKPSYLTRLFHKTLSGITWTLEKAIIPRIHHLEAYFFAKTASQAFTTFDAGKLCLATESSQKILSPYTPNIQNLWQGNVPKTLANFTNYLATQTKKTLSYVSHQTFLSLGIEKTLEQEIKTRVFARTEENQAIFDQFTSCVEHAGNQQTLDSCVNHLPSSLMEKGKTFLTDFAKSTSSRECSLYAGHLNFAISDASIVFYLGSLILGLELLVSLSKHLTSKKENNSDKIAEILPSTIKTLPEVADDEMELIDLPQDLVHILDQIKKR